MTDSGQTLERYRPYLLLLARQGLASRFQGKADLSGLVQQTLLDAHAAWGRLEALQEKERQAWLRRVLANNLRDEARRWTTAARHVAMEEALERSSLRLQSLLAAPRSSPSQRAAHNEELLRMAQLLADLPEAERQAIELHHLQGVPLAAIAEQLGRTKGAVAALLYRALKKLRAAAAAP